MKNLFVEMLQMQDSINSRIDPDWFTKGYKWYRYLYREAVELGEWLPYKHWKKTVADIPNAKIEVVDMWHFALSLIVSYEKQEAIKDGKEYSVEEIAEQLTQIWQEVLDHPLSEDLDIQNVIDSLVTSSAAGNFAITPFIVICRLLNFSIVELHQQYVAKNILNFFRQDHGYKEGTYHKHWFDGKEDNEFLIEEIDFHKGSDNFRDDVYNGLKATYDSYVHSLTHEAETVIEAPASTEMLAIQLDPNDHNPSDTVQRIIDSFGEAGTFDLNRCVFTDSDTGLNVYHVPTCDDDNMHINGNCYAFQKVNQTPMLLVFASDGSITSDTVELHNYVGDGYSIAMEHCIKDRERIQMRIAEDRALMNIEACGKDIVKDA